LTAQIVDFFFFKHALIKIVWD